MFLGTDQKVHNLFPHLVVISQTQFMFEKFFTAKITAWGTNGMVINPLESSKIVSMLSGVSIKSQRTCKQDI